jgi:phytoene dehydrogenase-like protein
MDVVIGAGMGGLAAAIALARRGRRVRIYEASQSIGGLASGFERRGKWHDGGPYILLDRPGLTWAFERLGLRIEEHLDLIRLDETWRVRRRDHPDVRIYHDIDRTVAGLEADFPGCGPAYRAFVQKMWVFFEHLQPLQREPHRGARGLVSRWLFREGVFLLRGLGHHLAETGLPQPIIDALGIWTHIAGQPLAEAPAPLAFVPAIVHNQGAYTVKGGIGRIPEALGRVARDLGVEIVTGAKVEKIVRDGRRVLGVEVAGDRVAADRVFSDAAGIATYAQLLSPPDAAMNAELEALPLQSPGVAAWMEAEVEPTVPFLQFWLEEGENCRVLVHAGAVDPSRRGTARLVSPVAHERAARLGREGQRQHLDRLVAETWWKSGLSSIDIVETRIPVEWGRKFHLWRDSMNPVMTASFMRKGRMPQCSPIADNLFLCGSSTHPGQWVSFCAISGVLAVDQAG